MEDPKLVSDDFIKERTQQLFSEITNYITARNHLTELRSALSTRGLKEKLKNVSISIPEPTDTQVRWIARTEKNIEIICQFFDSNPIQFKTSKENFEYLLSQTNLQNLAEDLLNHHKIKMFHEIINLNQGLIYSVAQEFVERRGLYGYFEDLVSYGQPGLIRAIETFIPEKGSFSNHAMGWISSFIDLQTRKNEYFLSLRSTTNIKQFHIIHKSPLELDRTQEDESGQLIAETIKDERIDFEKPITSEQLMMALERADMKMDPKLAFQILELRFGLNGNEKTDLKDIVNLLDIRALKSSKLISHQALSLKINEILLAIRTEWGIKTVQRSEEQKSQFQQTQQQ